PDWPALQDGQQTANVERDECLGSARVERNRRRRQRRKIAASAPGSRARGVSILLAMADAESDDPRPHDRRSSTPFRGDPARNESRDPESAAAADPHDGRFALGDSGTTASPNRAA